MVFSEKISLLGENQAEPNVVEAVVWSIAVTVRRTAAPRTVEPATTTTHTERPTFNTYRIRLI